MIEIGDYKAIIAYDPDIELFRGEFLGLNGGADFYASDVAGLRTEGEISLSAFLAICKEKGIEPKRSYSGKFNVRLSPELHEAAVVAASAEQKSLNEWIAKAVQDAAEAA